MTLLAGPAPVAGFATLSGTPDSVAVLGSFRAGRGPGDAPFAPAALAVTVGAAPGGSAARAEGSARSAGRPVRVN